jgi:DNA-binding NarL/FixJ family response regulator
LKGDSRPFGRSAELIAKSFFGMTGVLVRKPQHIRAMIADDHMVVREGLASILKRATNLSIVAQAGTWIEAIQVADEQAPELAILDVRMPGMEATEGVATLRRKHPDLRIVMISAFDCDEDIYGVIRAGANGFMVKNCSPLEIVSCIRAVLNGRRWLPAGPATKLLERMNAPPTHLPPNSDLANGDRRKVEQGSRRGPRHHGRDRKGPTQPHLS